MRASPPPRRRRMLVRRPAWLPATTLRLRLTIWNTAVLAGAFLVFSMALYLLVQRTLAAEADQAATSRVQEIVRAVESRPAPPQGTLEGLLPETALNVFSTPDTFVQIADARTGRIVARSASLGDQRLPIIPEALVAAQQGRWSFQSIEIGDDRLHVYTAPLRVHNEVIGVVQVGRSLTTDDRLLRRLGELLLVMAGSGLPAAALLGWILAGRSLQPIEEFARATEEIGRARDFSRRVDHHGAADELGHLAGMVNGMLSELEVAHRDLAAANERLEQGLTVQRRFVADASHELRTPLTTIRANVDVLRWAESDGQSERAQALRDIAEEAERMSRLVNDLLTLARADAGQRLQLRPTPLRPLLDEVVRHARLLATGQHVELAADDDVEVAGDPAALKQLLVILTDNALKFTPGGGGVTLSLRRISGEAVLTVADTGAGIAAADVPRIFERFYRADAVREIDGSGLGLAIAQWLVEQHGGRIAAVSRPGHGSTFTVSLPLAGRPELALPILMER